jgi:hypothetical protein
LTLIFQCTTYISSDQLWLQLDHQLNEFILSKNCNQEEEEAQKKEAGMVMKFF